MSDFSFETLAAQFVGTAARSVPEKLLSPIFASPLSARSPDLCMLWHPGYRKRHRLRLIIESLGALASDLCKGIVKLLISPRAFGYALYGKQSGSLLVLTSMCGSEAPDGKYKTVYVETEDDDALFVFGPKKECGRNAQAVNELTLIMKILLTFALVRSGISAFLKIKGGAVEKSLLLFRWLSWALSLQWLHDYYLEETLSETVKQKGIKKIGCIHEMHFYARVIWRVAALHGIRGYTIQHAAFSQGKRWYFSLPEEIESGLKLPDIIYVYSKRVSDVLEQYYKTTTFIPGCSARYAHWKDVGESEKEGSYYLFVGALAGFDNDVLISILRRIIETSYEGLPLRARLHPFAELSAGDRKWMASAEEKGTITVSKDTSLRDDIENAAAVIGMSTTVLEEALIMGIPVMQITHPDYLEYIDIEGIKGVLKKDHLEFSSKDLHDISDRQVDVDEMRNRLGLNNPVITYKRLFEDERPQKQ